MDLAGTGWRVGTEFSLGCGSGFSVLDRRAGLDSGHGFGAGMSQASGTEKTIDNRASGMIICLVLGVITVVEKSW